MRFLATTTIVGPIVLVILTIWIWFAFGTRAHAWTDNWRPTPWGSAQTTTFRDRAGNITGTHRQWHDHVS